MARIAVGERRHLLERPAVARPAQDEMLRLHGDAAHVHAREAELPVGAGAGGLRNAVGQAALLRIVVGGAQRDVRALYHAEKNRRNKK